MAEYKLDIEVGYQPKQLDSVCDKIESKLSEIEANVKVTPQTKNLVRQTKEATRSLVQDAFNELSKLDPADITGEKIQKVFKNLLDGLKKSVNEIAESVKVSTGDDKLVSGLIDGFDELTTITISYGKVVENVVDKMKDLGSSVNIMQNIKKQYQEMIQQLKELDVAANSIEDNTTDFLGSLDSIEKKKEAFKELKKAYNETNQSFMTVNYMRQEAKSTDERLVYEKRLLEIDVKRLQIAHQLEALRSDIRAEDPTAKMRILNFSSDVTQQLRALGSGSNDFSTLIKTKISQLEEQAYGISVLTAKELDLAGILNTGAINVAARLEITTTKEEMVEKIKAKLLEVQKAINDEQNLVVPIKYVITTNEKDTLSNTERRNLEKSAQRNIQGAVGDVIVDAGQIFADIEKRGTDAAESLANQAVDKIQGVFDEKKIDVKFDTENAIKNLETALTDEKMGSSIDIAKSLDDANEAAGKLLSYFKDITEELRKQDSTFDSREPLQPSKYNTENIAQTTQQALEEARKAVNTLNTFFAQKENQIAVHFNIEESIKNLEKEIQGEDLSTKIDISKNLKNAKTVSEQILENVNTLIERLRSIYDIDFKSKNIGEFDFTNMLSQIDQIASELAAIVTEIKQLQDIKFTASIPIDFSDALANINNLSDAVVLLAGEIETIGKSNNLGNLNSILGDIQKKVRNIKDAVNNINVKDNVIKSFENLRDALDVLSNTKLKNFADFANTTKNLSTLDGKNLKSVFKSFGGLSKKDIDNIGVIGTRLHALKKELDTLDKTNFSGFLKQLEHILKSSEALKALATVVKKTGTNIKKLESSLSNVDESSVKDIRKIEKSLASIADTKKIRNFEILKTKIRDFNAEVKRVNDLNPNLVFQSDLQKIENLKQDIIKLYNNLPNVDVSIVKEVKKIESALEHLKQPKNIGRFLSDYEGKLKNLRNKIIEFKTEVERINELSPHLVFQSDLQKIERLKNEIIQINQNLDESEKKATSPAKENAIAKLNKFLKDSTKLTKEEREQLEALIKRLNNPNLSMREFKEIMTAFNNIKSNAIQAGRATTSFFDAIRNKLKYGWAQSIAQFFSFYDIIRYIRQISSTVTELNSSLIELAKVSDATVGELYTQFQDFADIAKQTGGTVNDIIKATSEWSRSGFNLAESKDLARISSIFQNIGDGISQEQANEYLVSTLKGFRLEAENSMHILDVINNVSNNAAAGVSDIGEALERSSSALGAANTSFEKSVALLTTAQEILQSPETVGTAFKSLSARLRAADTEIESLEDGFTLTTSKLRDLVQALTGFDIQLTADSYKDIYEILLGISKEWNNLTDLEQASLSEELFGKRNSQVGFAILQNGKRLEEIYALAENSAESAMTEQEKYMESVTYQIDRFKASLETLANDAMSSGFLKEIIAGARTLVDLLDVIMDDLGAFPVLLGSIGAIVSAKGWGITGTKLAEDFGFMTNGQPLSSDFFEIISDEDTKALKEFNSLLDENVSFTEAFERSMTSASEGAQEFAKGFEHATKGTRDVNEEYHDLINAQNELNITQAASSHSLSGSAKIIEYYNSNIQGSSSATESFTAAIDTNNHSLAAYIASLNGAKGSLLGYIQFAGAAAIETLAFKAAAMAMQMVLVTFVTFVVQKGFQALDYLIHRTEKLAEKANEAKSAIADLKKEMESQKKVISDVAERYAELAQGVNQTTGENVSLKNEDYQEFLDISNKLIEAFPTLSHHYNENGDAIADLNGDVKSITSSLQDLLDAEIALANQEMKDKTADVFGGFEKLKGEYEADTAELMMQANELQNTINELKTNLDVGVYEDAETIAAVQDSIINYEKELESVYNQMAAKKDEYNQKFGKDFASYVSVWLNDEASYKGLDTVVQTAFQGAIQNLDWIKLNFSNWDVAWDYITKQLEKLKANPDLQDGIKIAFEAQTEFDNNKITFEEYRNKIETLIQLLESLKEIDPELKEAIYAKLNIEVDDGTLYNTTYNRIQKEVNELLSNVEFKSEEVEGSIRVAIEDLINSLDKEEFEILASLDLDKEDSLRNLYKSVKEIEAADTYYDALEKLIAEHRKFSDSFQINYDKTNVETATNGIQKLQSAYQSLYENRKAGKSGSDLALLMTDITALKKELVKADGSFAISKDTWNEFFDVMTDGSHSFDEMTAALNKLLTEYVSATVDLKNFDQAQADAISTQLQLAGVTKESADEYVTAMTAKAEAMEYVEKKNFDLESATYEEIASFINEANISALAKEQLYLYALEKQLAAGINIETVDDCQQLYNLASAAQVSAEKLARLSELQGDLAKAQKTYEDAVKSGDSAAEDAAIKQLQNVKRILNTFAKEDIAKDMKVVITPEIKIDETKLKDKSKSGGSSGKEEDPWKEAYEKELAALNHLHEMELISDIQYYEEREKLNDKYFKDNEKYTEEYNKNLEEIYKGFQSAYKSYVDDMTDYWQKALDANAISFQEYCKEVKGMLDSLYSAGKLDAQTYHENLEKYYGTVVSEYDKVINAVQRTIKKRIDALNKEKEALEKSYEKRKEVIQSEIDSIEEQIKATEEEIKKLQDANKERQAAINMQKALYELNRAENQKTQFVYNSEKGFVYQSNAADIKAAQDEIENLRYEQKVATLEKTVDTLNDKIGDLEEQISQLDDELDKHKEIIDEQIEKLQEYSDKWGEVANKYEEAQEDMLAAAILGSDWQTEILNYDQELVQNFESMYVQAQKNQAQAALAAANDVVTAINKRIEALKELQKAEADAKSASQVSGVSTSSTVSTKTSSKESVTPKVPPKVPPKVTPNSNVNKVSVNNNSSRRISGHTVYGTGTDHAYPGYHEVAESGDEIILDNHGGAYLAEGHQLHRFEGGEKVYSSNETAELLKGKYIPIDNLLPNYTSMLNKVVSARLLSPMPNNNVMQTMKGNIPPTSLDNSVHIEIGDIHVTEVDNAAQIARVIKNQLPNALLQEINRK